jgi:hypothetical protein
VNSAASLAAGLPVGRLSARCLVLAAYLVPAAAVWAALGVALLALTRVLPLAGVALVLTAIYGCCYGVAEIAGPGRLAVPGRRWQVPQSMMIDSSPWRRVLVWGALLGPGFATRNPYAGFGLLPIAVAATVAFRPGAGVVLAVAIGLAHGGARAAALLRDIAGGQPASPPDAAGQLELLLRTVYWRRLDGAMLLAVAAIAVAASTTHFLT